MCKTNTESVDNALFARQITDMTDAAARQYKPDSQLLDASSKLAG